MNTKVLSFFTGGGLLDIGFEKTGFDIVWGNEFNPQFAELFHEGYSSEIVNNAFSGTKPDIFGMIGGPPCPDFSNGGLHKGSEGDRGKLSRTYIDIICAMKPTFFVMENVSGLMNVKKHQPYLAELEYKLRKSGYYVDKKVLNSLDFGVPQHRERLFLVGIQRHILELVFGRDLTESDPWFIWPSPKFESAAINFDWPGINTYGATPIKPLKVPEELCIMDCLVPTEQQNNIANAGNYFKPYSDKFHLIDEGDTRRKSFKRLHRYRYSPTACYGNNEVHLHPFEPRRLSLREVMRIQGLPEGYVLPENCTLSTGFKMISNGVPVPLAFNLARSIKEIIDIL